MRRITISLLFILVCLTWGTTWLAMKIAVDTIPPVFATGMRFIAASPLLIVKRLNFEYIINMSYSLDFRQKVLAIKKEKGLSIRETAKRFCIGSATVSRWIKQIEPILNKLQDAREG